MICEYPNALLLKSTDRFQIEASIINGGSGSIWLAYDKLLCSNVALKSLFCWGSDIQALRLEVLAGRTIQSPYVLRSFDLIKIQRTDCIVMQYIAGITMGGFLGRGLIVPEDARRFMFQLCHGVSAIHQAGFAHCDLVSNNILVSYDGDLTIVDFGSTKLLREQKKIELQLVMEDIFALRLLLVKIAVAALKSGFDDYWLEFVLLKCCSSCSRNRYETAAELLRDLDISDSAAYISLESGRQAV